MDEELMSDVNAMMRLNRTVRLLQTQFFRDAYAERKVSLPQYSVLGVLEEHGECTMGRLAEALGVTMGAATSLVDRLIHLRYVERERSTEDRRVVKVRLTASGREVFRAIDDHSRMFAAQAIGPVSPGDRQAFIRVQERAVEAFQEALKRLRQGRESGKP